MTEKKAKFSSPPATRVRGLIVVCSMAMPSPMVNDEASSTGKVGKSAKSSEPTSGSAKPTPSTNFWLKRSIRRPEGIDMMP